VRSANFDQLESERLDLGDDAVERCLMASVPVSAVLVPCASALSVGKAASSVSLSSPRTLSVVIAAASANSGFHLLLASLAR
jgi:hypothetical protein